MQNVNVWDTLKGPFVLQENEVRKIKSNLTRVGLNSDHVPYYKTNSLNLIISCNNR